MNMERLKRYTGKIAMAAVIFSMIMTVSSCKKKNFDLGDYEGDPICASDKFQFTAGNDFTISPSTIDFTTTPYVNFTGVMNEKVEWTLTIKGNTTGAIKTFTQRNTVMDVKWYGNADNDLFFGAESCSVTLSISCKDPITASLTISTVANFADPGSFLLLSNWDGVLPGNQGTWLEYHNAGINASIDNTTPSPQGGKYRHFDGAYGWYIGGFDQAVDLNAFMAGQGVSSPDSIYLNFYLQGSTVTVPTLAITESGAKFSKNVVINWTGWKLVSYKLSDFNILNPGNITNIAVSIGPNIYAANCNVDFDMFVLTARRPLNAPN